MTPTTAMVRNGRDDLFRRVAVCTTLPRDRATRLNGGVSSPVAAALTTEDGIGVQLVGRFTIVVSTGFRITLLCLYVFRRRLPKDKTTGHHLLTLQNTGNDRIDRFIRICITVLLQSIRGPVLD